MILIALCIVKRNLFIGNLNDRHVVDPSSSLVTIIFDAQSRCPQHMIIRSMCCLYIALDSIICRYECPSARKRSPIEQDVEYLADLLIQHAKDNITNTQILGLIVTSGNPQAQLIYQDTC